MQNMTFAMACKKHLALPHETLNQLAAELKKLTPEDKEQLTEDFKAIGVNVIQR